jgi:hypothetical protein
MVRAWKLPDFCNGDAVRYPVFQWITNCRY